MNITPRLVIIGPEPGIRRTYNLIGFPIIIGSSDNANITLKGCGLEQQHIYLDEIDNSHIRIRRIVDCSIISQRKNVNEKIIEDRDTFIAGKVGLQFFVPNFEPNVRKPMVLEFLTGKNMGKMIMYDSTLTVGRRVNNNICLPYKKVSGLHGIFNFGDVLSFTDKNSRNGSRINGKKVKPESTMTIHAGDIIDIASHALYLRPADYRPKKVQEQLIKFLSEFPIEKPSYDEYSPISELPFDEIPTPELNTDSYKNLHAQVKESIRNVKFRDDEEEDLLYLGPDEDFDASDFEHMLTEIQNTIKPSIRQTERMPKAEVDVDEESQSSIADVDAKTYKGKSILSDTYFNKIRREAKEENDKESD